MLFLSIGWLLFELPPQDDNTNNDANAASINLNDLLDSYDVNKITQEQYDKARFLNKLDNIVNENTENNEENNDIVNQEGENKEIKEIKEENNNSDIDDDYYSEFNKIEIKKMEFEKSLGTKLFIKVYHYINDILDDKNLDYDEEKVKEKIKDDFGNKGYNEKDVNLIIQKYNDIFSLILKEKSID